MKLIALLILAFASASAQQKPLPKTEAEWKQRSQEAQRAYFHKPIDIQACDSIEVTDLAFELRVESAKSFAELHVHPGHAQFVCVKWDGSNPTHGRIDADENIKLLTLRRAVERKHIPEGPNLQEDINAFQDYDKYLCDKYGATGIVIFDATGIAEWRTK